MRRHPSQHQTPLLPPRLITNLNLTSHFSSSWGLSTCCCLCWRTHPQTSFHQGFLASPPRLFPSPHAHTTCLLPCLTNDCGIVSQAHGRPGKAPEDLQHPRPRPPTPLLSLPVLILDDSIHNFFHLFGEVGRVGGELLSRWPPALFLLLALLVLVSATGAGGRGGGAGVAVPLAFSR